MIDELGKFVEEATKAGIMLAAVGGPSALGTERSDRVDQAVSERCRQGESTIRDVF